MGITQRDPLQTALYEHNEEHNAKRVVLVGGELPPVQVDMSNFKMEPQQVQVIEVPRTEVVTVREVEIREIQVPYIIIQKEFVEVPVIIKEVVEVIREVPVVQTKVELVDKPIIIRDTEYKDLPKGLVICLVAQVVVSMIMLLKMLLLK